MRPAEGSTPNGSYPGQEPRFAPAQVHKLGQKSVSLPSLTRDNLPLHMCPKQDRD